MPAYEAALIIIDLVTAVLLLGRGSLTGAAIRRAFADSP
jgi:hypothetical protein